MKKILVIAFMVLISQTNAQDIVEINSKKNCSIIEDVFYSDLLNRMDSILISVTNMKTIDSSYRAYFIHREEYNKLPEIKHAIFEYLFFLDMELQFRLLSKR